ncbi:hypothetical protein [Actinomadura xylanilytica]|uniref:hypothetical protein n=1 Tax=Actinomadura xylanilytica TaxID=887459 RepID=UPI00255AB1F7|nr:hypothetical protein [Actinomadura xylanilytica]MDL4772794.1 hypothetical protein [Actinomadura xylanilytica]
MTLAGNLRENKAVYTVAGAGDLAVEKLREVPEQVTRARETATKYQDEVRGNLDKYRDQVRGTVDRYRAEARKNVDRYRGEARENVTKLQDRVDAKDLPGAAVAYVTHFGSRTVGFIDELAERGKGVVHRGAAEVAGSAEDVAAVTAGDAGKPAARKPAAGRTKKSGA